MKNKILPAFTVFISLCAVAQNAATITISHVPQATPALFRVIHSGELDTAVQALVPDTNKVLTFAEVMPDFPGGFNKYLAEHIKYPAVEKAAKKQGTVYISFVIEKDGTVTNVREAKGVEGAPGLTKEAIRVISNMPKWKPGTMNGKPVCIEMKQPIRFVLDTKVPKRVRGL